MMQLPLSDLIPYLVAMLSPVIIFFIVSLALSNRKNRSAIMWGVFASLLIAGIIYTFLPLMVS